MTDLGRGPEGERLLRDRLSRSNYAVMLASTMRYFSQMWKTFLADRSTVPTKDFRSRFM